MLGAFQREKALPGNQQLTSEKETGRKGIIMEFAVCIYYASSQPILTFH